MADIAECEMRRAAPSGEARREAARPVTTERRWGGGNPRAGVPRGASASAGRGARGKHEDDASTTRRDVVDSQIRFGLMI